MQTAPALAPAPPAPADASRPIDLDHLAHQTFGDRDLQAELLGLFAHQARGILKALDASFGATATSAQSAHPRPADLLHTLCGSARAVGSWTIATQAEDLESALRRPAGQPLGREQLAALGRSVGEACAAIDDLSQGGGR